MKLVCTVSLALLVAICCVQWWTLRSLKSEMAGLRDQASVETMRLARGQFSDERRAELRRMVMWLDAFYRAPDGLGRPGGVCSDNQLDSASIEQLMDPYLRARVGGASEEAARQQVADAIKDMPEWRQKHPAAP